MNRDSQLKDGLTVTGLPAFTDNYLWLLHDHRGHAVAIDPGDAQVVEHGLRQRNLKLVGILVTHHHPDHIGGVAELAEHHHCPVLGPADPRIPMVQQRLVDGDCIQLEQIDMRLRAIHVPGHTLSHLAYVGHGAVFVGDTLFSAGCGRLFEGTPAQMLHSLDLLNALDPATLLFCAHEYTRDNARFALDWEPDNAALRARYRESCQAHQTGTATVPSRLSQERTYNPFLRCDQSTIRERLETSFQRELSTRLEVFTALRQRRNGYVAVHADA
jgi:hydroxyacylglutathione hydrolase